MKKFSKTISLIAAVLLTLSGCGQTSAPATSSAVSAPRGEVATAGQQATRTVTDLMGRQVELPQEIDSVICTGSGALRLVCYAQGADLVTGVEDTDKKRQIARPYNYVYSPQFQDLPSIGKGGGRGYTAYEEEIISLQPDVILTAYTSDALEELAAKTGIPVVSIGYQSNLFDPSVSQALTLVGQVLGREERCAQLVEAMEEIKQDLAERTKDIPQEEKPSAYAGAVTYSGGHGFGGTYSNFGPFTAIGAVNVADGIRQEGGFEVDLEQILAWDPDVIFLDPANMSLVQDEYAKNPAYFRSLRAVQEGKVYALPCFNQYATNIEIAIADAYYAGKVLFPEQFADVDMDQKADELLELFLGTAFYSEMKEAGLSFEPITIGP